MAVIVPIVLILLLAYFWETLSALTAEIQLAAGLAAIGALALTWWGLIRKTPSPDPVPAPTPPRPDLSRRYYQALATDCQRVDMSVIDPAAGLEHNAVRLSDVYTDQLVAPWQESVERDPDKREMPQREPREPGPLLQAAAEPGARRVVVLGPVGSGKSSFVNLLAWQVARSHLGEVPEGLAADLVRRPLVRILLRNVAKGGIEAEGAELLWRAAGAELQARLGGNAGAEALFGECRPRLAERGLWLLDGLDEVPEAGGARADMLDAIDALAGELGQGARILVTSRNYAYARPEQRLAGWPVLDIQEMEPERVAAFLGGWYRIMAPRKGWDDQTAEKEAGRLAELLQERDYLARMAGRPLLLTLIASLHLGRGELPHNRGHLYRQAIELLLRRWHERLRRQDYPMDPEVLDLLSQDPEVLEHALAELAFKVHERQGRERAAGGEPRDIADYEAAGLFSAHLRNDRELLEFLDTHSGILSGDGRGSFRFAHRSFQEYLAAVQLSGTADGDHYLRQRLAEQPDWWREVWLMYVSRVSDAKPMVRGLLDLLLPADWAQRPPEERNAQAPLLAGLALRDLRLPEQREQWGILDDLTERTRHALAAAAEQAALPLGDRLELGAVLSGLGDPRPGVAQTLERDGVRLPVIRWVDIPGGLCRIGSDGSDKAAFAHEKPVIERELPAFRLARYPVTNAQFACFVDDGGYREARWWLDAGRDWWRSEKPQAPAFWKHPRWGQANRPVLGVSWFEARAFCAWLGERSGERRLDLPTEAQWERAARGGPRRIRPWGDGWEVGCCNSLEAGLGETCAVGLFPGGDTPDGLTELAGNCWEWTLSRWCDDYGKVDEDWENPAGEGRRVLRGGSFGVDRHFVRAAYRSHVHPSNRLDFVGFRVCCVPPPIDL